MRRLAKRLNLSSSATDAVIVTVGAIVFLGFMAAFDIHEKFDNYMRSHEEYQLDEIILALMCSGVAGYVYALRRLSELKRETRARTIAETKATWISFHDFLTKLPNRRFLDEQASLVVRENFSDRYAVCAIDLDGFKKVNDLIGHEGGDTLLVTIANRLSKAFNDAIVIRVGGDEFLAITPCHDAEELRLLCDSVVTELSKPVDVAGIHAEVGACIGYARYPEDALSLKDLAMRADVALYAAKHRGRNSVAAYLAAMSETLTRRAKDEGRLRRAVREKSICPHYQPLIDLETGQLRGFEALARWKVDENHFISPTDFIPMAEDIGLIVELSYQLLRRACLDALAWPSHIKLAFNISPMMMVDHLLCMRIVKALGETGLSPHRLEIEITETALVRDMDLAAKAVQDLRLAGIQIVLDDFGTGYSSLSQLSRLSFDNIKIDRSFIAGIESDEWKMNIVRTMVSLGRELGIKTTAEGLETPEQLQVLKELGCSYAQGFLFGHAVPAEEAFAFIHSDEQRLLQKA